MNHRIDPSRIRQVVILGIVLVLAVTGYSMLRYPGILLPRRVGLLFAGVLLVALLSYLIITWRLTLHMDSDATWSAHQGLNCGFLIAGFWFLEIVAGNLLDPTYTVVRILYFGSSLVAFSLPLFAGIFGALHSGMIRTGILIGVWSGIVSGLLTFLSLMAVTVVFLNQMLQDPQNILQFQGSGASDLVTFVMGDSLAGATGHLVIGLLLAPGFAAIGAVFGKALQSQKPRL
jgi:hypothetical protein